MSNELKNPPPLRKPVPPIGTTMATMPPPAGVVAAQPRRQAFSIERGLHGWCFVTITYTDDGKTVEVERSQPDLKVMALEKFKIAAAKYWNDIG